MSKEEDLLIVSIYLKGGQLKPSAVSDALLIQPTRSHELGELLGKSKEIAARTGVWVTTAQTKSTQFADHIEELLGNFRFFSSRLDEIEGVEDAFFDIFIASDAPIDGDCSFALDKSTVRRIGQLGLGLQFTVS